jgi:hypothetical protein
MGCWRLLQRIVALNSPGLSYSSGRLCQFFSTSQHNLDNPRLSPLPHAAFFHSLQVRMLFEELVFHQDTFVTTFMQTEANRIAGAPKSHEYDKIVWRGEKSGQYRAVL